MKTDKTAFDINMLVDNAVVYYDKFDPSTITDVASYIKTLADKELGIIEDTLKFEAKPDIHDIKHAGSNGNKEVGWQRITGWTTKIQTNILNFNDTVFGSSLLVKDEKGFYTPITEGLIPIENYKDLIIVGEDLKDGTPHLIVVKNSYNTEGISLEFKDKNENAVKMQFEGHSKGKEKPFYIW